MSTGSVTNPGEPTPPKGGSGYFAHNREAASKAGKASAAARRKRKAEILAHASDPSELALCEQILSESSRTGSLSGPARHAARRLLRRVMFGEIPVRHASDAAVLARALVDIARLESGQATSHVAHQSQDVGPLLERVRNETDNSVTPQVTALETGELEPVESDTTPPSPPSP